MEYENSHAQRVSKNPAIAISCAFLSVSTSQLLLLGFSAPPQGLYRYGQVDPFNERV